jgi:subtilase family serine protease
MLRSKNFPVSIKGEIVIRKLSVSLLMFAAMVSALTVVSQAESALLTRHVRDAVVSGEAKPVGRMPANQTMRFSVVLALRHQPELDNFLQDVYDPTSANYRKFVTVEQFTERFGPSQEDYDTVLAFAKASGFTVIGGSRDGFNVELKGSVANVEKAFNITMGLYQHPTENRTFFAPDREPTTNLSVRLWHVSGLDNYSIPRALYKHKAVSAHAQTVKGSCPSASYCGSDMRAAYYGGTALTGAGQNIALLELAGTDLADLTTYYKNAKQTEPYTPTLVSTGGYKTACLESGGCDDTEQTLDMTQAMGMAPGSTMLYMYVCGDAYGTGTFDETDCLSAMTTASPLSNQISCSWAWTPADPSSDDPYYQKFSAQGQNFFTASGDGGSYPSNSRPYYYPAEDDYVTAVGGTDLQVASAGGPWSSETAWPDSGGGISQDNIPIPAWQQLPGVITTANKGSKTLRNVPDVAAEANFDFYVCADQSGCTANEYGGTSFAAPMWAGYMALVNEQAIENGNPSLGFVNPAIYNLGVGSGYATAFHDITSGSNGGFSAEKGYDLVTGWGSPNGNGLIAALAGTGGGGGPIVSFSPTSLTFPKRALGTTSAAKKVVLTNTGTATLNLTTIAISGEFALATVKQTKKVTPCVTGGTVAAGASCTFAVTFTPTQAGALTGDVTFTDNATGSPQQFSLSGTGK